VTRDPVLHPLAVAARTSSPAAVQCRPATKPEGATVAGSGGLPSGLAGPPPSPSAQRVWRRAAEATHPLDRHDVLAVVLELLRAARHDVATVSHALTIGRRWALEHPSDVGVDSGVMFLEQALTFMGVEPNGGDR
jgi:hypothetical protein